MERHIPRNNHCANKGCSFALQKNFENPTSIRNRKPAPDVLHFIARLRNFY